MVLGLFGSNKKQAQDLINQAAREDLNRSRARSKERELREQQLVSRVNRREEAKFLQPIRQTGFNIGRSIGQFGAVSQIEPDFSQEQEALRGMFGHGEKIWGTVGEPVRLNHDLNPRQRGDFGTSEMFGF